MDGIKLGAYTDLFDLITALSNCVPHGLCLCFCKWSWVWSFKLWSPDDLSASLKNKVCGNTGQWQPGNTACVIYVYIYVCMYIVYIFIYIYVCIYAYIYRNICMMKFLWNFILKFFFKQIGSCHGTGFVVAGGTAGTGFVVARGGKMGFMAALDCSMFNVYSALTIYLFSRPSFIQNSVGCSIARSFVSYGFWW